jgi:hypothetical protein
MPFLLFLPPLYPHYTPIMCRRYGILSLISASRGMGGREGDEEGIGGGRGGTGGG